MKDTSYIENYKKIFKEAKKDGNYTLQNKSSNSFINDFNNFRDSLNKYISNKKKDDIDLSLDYSEITKIIFYFDEGTSETKFDEIINRIRKEVDKIKNKKVGEDSNQLKSLLDKILIHTDLAYIQKKAILESNKDEISKLHQKMDSFNEKYLDLEKKLEDANGEIAKYQRKLEKSTMDMLAVIGIFSTIIFAVFGGLSQLAALGGSLSTTPIHKIFIYTGITATVLSLVVFLSFYSLSKFTMLNLSSCGCKTENCTHNLMEKHPVISFSLWIFFSFIVTGFIILLMKNYIDFGFESDKFYSQEIIILMLLILPFIGVCILVKNLLCKK